MFDVLIIGAGPAGIYAATYAGLKKLKVLVIEASSEIGGQPIYLYGHKKIFDFPGHLETSGVQLIKNLLNQQVHLKEYISYQLNTRLVSYQKLSSGNFVAQLSSHSINCKAILIATGNGGYEPIELDPSLIKDEHAKKKIHYFVKDFSNYENQNVVILGGGDAAVEWTTQIAASNLPKNVTIIHRKPTYRANQYYVDSLNQMTKIKQILNVQVTAILNGLIKFKDNDTNHEDRVGFDTLIVQYGLKSLTNRASEWANLKKQGASIVVDRKQETSDADVYAIGLSANYPERSNLMITAMAEATIAIKAINRKIHPYAAVDYIDPTIK